MNRQMRRRLQAIGGRGRTESPSLETQGLSFRFNTASPRVLLLGTALASTFLLTSIVVPQQAQAVITCVGDVGTGPDPIDQYGADSINCRNDEARTADGTTPYFAAISLETYNPGTFPIKLKSKGKLKANSAAYLQAYGIRTVTNSGDGSRIDIEQEGPIEVLNTYPGFGGGAYGIFAYTNNTGGGIDVTTSGDIDAKSSGYAAGIFARTSQDGSNIEISNADAVRAKVTVGGVSSGLYAYAQGSATITNTGEIKSSVRGYGTAFGIFLNARGGSGDVQSRRDIKVDLGLSGTAQGIAASSTGPLKIETKGDISVNVGVFGGVFGINAYSARSLTIDTKSHISATLGQSGAASGINTYSLGRQHITATGDITAKVGDLGSAFGIAAFSRGFLGIESSGKIKASSGIEAIGIGAAGYGRQRIIVSGKIVATADEEAYGIFAETFADNSSITIVNSAKIKATASEGETEGIYADTVGDNSKISVTNTGNIHSVGRDTADAIDVEVEGDDSSITIVNDGDLKVVTRRGVGSGIEAYVYDGAARSKIDITNRGDINVRGGTFSNGIYTYSYGPRSSTTIHNLGDIRSRTTDPRGYAYGIDSRSFGDNNAIKIVSGGNIEATGAFQAVGIQAWSRFYGTPYTNAPISITNHGDIVVEATRDLGERFNYAIGILAISENRSSPVTIVNSGSVFAKGGPRNVGVYSISPYFNNKTTIFNTGEIGAQSHLAIDVKGAGTADIFNAGTITGFVDLTGQNDTFVNQAGGVFETKKTSFFGGGDDLFVNQIGGTIQAATDPFKRERSGFRGLETFKNAGGTISLVDGGIGDRFTIANAPGAANLKFEGGGFLAVDAELGGPGSKADNFIVDGNVSGQTKVLVNNVSPQPGAFNAQGIPVVFVDGNTPREGNFVLANGPIDAGLFDYDLFFEPTGSGFWELRSFAGGSAHALPKLLTAAQDIWHQSSATWFDRTADLRVVLNQGGVGGSSPSSSGNGLSPGAWIKGGGSWLEREASATTSAFGRSYDFDLDGELQSVDLQVGLDGGAYNVLSDGDALIVGVLGGFVGGNLDFDALADQYNFSGGQVGAYATYLNDGLFVDTLVNVHLYEIDTPNLGFPNSLDATTVGVRTDAGYRFGSFTGGAFFEPLATIAVTWADIDGFNVGGNKVSFSDDANVRGRLGARVGTTMSVWEGTTLEPFLIASLWSNLSDENSATLLSSGRTFQFQDDLQDVWGEVSAGANLFNFNETTSVFAKADVTFGEDISGISGKGGVRVSW